MFKQLVLINYSEYFLYDSRRAYKMHRFAVYALFFGLDRIFILQ